MHYNLSSDKKKENFYTEFVRPYHGTIKNLSGVFCDIYFNRLFSFARRFSSTTIVLMHSLHVGRLFDHWFTLNSFFCRVFLQAQHCVSLVRFSNVFLDALFFCFCFNCFIFTNLLSLVVM